VHNALLRERGRDLKNPKTTCNAPVTKRMFVTVGTLPGILAHYDRSVSVPISVLAKPLGSAAFRIHSAAQPDRAAPVSPPPGRRGLSLSPMAR